MTVPRLFHPDPLTDRVELELDTETAHHATRVLRLRPDAEVILFDGHGGEYPGRITAVAGRQVRVALGPHQPVERESPLRVTLLQGLAKGERMDYLMQKAVELGVEAIQPVTTARSVVRLEARRAARRHDHWRGVITAACAQCGRNRPPRLEPLAGLCEALGAASTGLRLVLAPGAPQRLRDLTATPHITLLVGPEGGLAPAELKEAQGAGFLGLDLGPRVLRTETAGVAALAALQGLWGDLG